MQTRLRPALALSAWMAMPLSLAAQNAPARVDSAAPSAAARQPGDSAYQQRRVAAGMPLMVDRVVAVVGDQPILWTDVMTAVNQKRAGGLRVPPDSAGQMATAREVLNELVDVEILVQQARDLKIEVTDAEVTAAVDQQIRRVHSQFPAEEDYRRELRAAGFGTPEEYRRTLIDGLRRQSLQERAFSELRKKAHPADITDQEVTAAFERFRDQLGRRPATISFRQIVVTPRPSAGAKAGALAKAESLLVEIRKGGDFEQVARRESMDPGSRELGGDLGWSRRGSGFVPEFERVVFALAPGQLSPIIETPFGYHIIRVDRVQPAEVKSRHILIRPVIDSADIAAARDTAASLAAQWRRGVSFEALVAKHHDPSEERGILQPFPRDSLPQSYQTAIAGKRVGEVTDPFTLGDAQRGLKFGVLEVVALTEGGQYSETEVRTQIRAQLQAEKSARALLDGLRRRTYVSIRL